MSTPRKVSVRTLAEAPGIGRAALQSMRIYQWVKNLLVFAPLLLAHEILDASRGLAAALLFAGFCAVASATYILNDLLDIESDRRHERKRHRPFAAGSLPIPIGIGLMLALLAAGFAVPALWVSPGATAALAAYAALAISYSFLWKERIILDVMVLAGLYTLRVIAGGVAARVPVSPWLLAFCLFFFLSLAFLKRYSELASARARQEQAVERRGYRVDDIGLIESLGAASGYMAVLVLCLYVSAADVSRLYARPELLWLAIPVFLFWITRAWFRARRGELSDDPVLFAATDPVTYLCLASIGVIGALAATSP